MTEEQTEIEEPEFSWLVGDGDRVDEDFIERHLVQQ